MINCFYTFYISSRFMSLQLFANFYSKILHKNFLIHLLIAFRSRYQSTTSSSLKHMHTSRNICVEIRGESFLIVRTQQITGTLFQKQDRVIPFLSITTSELNLNAICENIVCKTLNMWPLFITQILFSC